MGNNTIFVFFVLILLTFEKISVIINYQIDIYCNQQRKEFIMKITYEQMPETAKKAYRKADKFRKITLFLCLAITVLFLILFAKVFEGSALLEGIFSAFLVGSMLQGLVHALPLTKSIYFKLKKWIVDMIIFAPVLLVIPLFPLVLFLYIGFVFEILDLILFIRKKPLVYGFENSLFLDSKAAQEEIQAEQQKELYKNAMQELTSENPNQKMIQLRQMLDNGLITEEEYHQKKTELLKNM